MDYLDNMSIRDRREYIKNLVNRNNSNTSKFYINSNIIKDKFK
jgi:hypothetical protein